MCHLFIEGAPSPDLAHIGQFGPACVSTHHPNPCDYTSKDGPCTYSAEMFRKVSDEALEEQLTAAQFSARDKTRQAELDKMAGELVSFRQQQVDMDKMSSEMSEIKKLLMSLRPSAQPGSSLADNTVHTKVGSENLPVSTNTVSLSSANPSLLGASGGSIHDDVARHIQKNTVPPPTTQPRGSYSGPTMPDLRKDESLNLVAQQVLAALEQRIPQIREHFASPDIGSQHLQSVAPTTSVGASFSTATSVTSALGSRPTTSIINTGQGFHHPAYQALLSGQEVPVQQGGVQARSLQPQQPPHTEDFMDAAQIMQLCTVSNRRELRPHEFVRMGRFSYANKITDKNITVPLFVMGYLQYVVAMLKGVAPQQSETEVVDRLTNLMTIMEITANNSTLDDFKTPGWSIGLEYAGRIFHDIEYGRIKWENLSEGLQAHTFLYAKDTVEMQQGKGNKGRVSDQPRGRGNGRGRGGGRGKFDEKADTSQDSIKVCQSYNGFWTGSGCAYEYSNNRKCAYEHFCSSCFEKNGTKESHKAYYCQPDGKSSKDGNGTGIGTVKPAVTSG